ncbi:MAG: DUF1788 domain-containing protein [Candidatus Promineifilaceae bacterium]
MKADLQKAPIDDRFNHLLTVLKSERFLKKQGLGNEVPFFICPYAPQEQNDMAEIQGHLQKQLAQRGIRVLAINLYNLSIELLKGRGIWDRILQIEPTVDRDRLLELLQSTLDPETHLVPAIAAKMQDEAFDILFVSGVGEVFPYIRSHNVLNNLQRVAKEQPTVMFFPGDYIQTVASGASLRLFGRLHDDKYYRAFNIYHYEV